MKSPYEIVQVIESLKILARAEAERAAAQVADTDAKKPQYGALEAAVYSIDPSKGPQ